MLPNVDSIVDVLILCNLCSRVRWLLQSKVILELMSKKNEETTQVAHQDGLLQRHFQGVGAVLVTAIDERQISRHIEPE